MGLNKFFQPWSSQAQAVEETPVAGVESALPAALRHVTSVNNTSAGPILEEVDASYPLNFDLYIPTNVIYLQRAQLRIKPRAIRSTTTGAASGGSTTSGTEAAHTHTVTIGSHTHSLSGVTTDSGGGSTSGSGGGQTSSNPSATHNHTNEFADLSGGTAVMYGGGGATVFRVVGGGSTLTSSASAVHTHDVINHTHTTPNHTHDFTAQTTASGGSSTPTSSGGASHSHTVSAHTHTQTYGIYEGTSAAGITITINGTDRTTALGGPWDAAALLNITTYLKDANGDVVTGVHTISLTTTTLGRIEVWQDLTSIVEEVTP